MDTNYKRIVAGSVGAGLGAILNANGRTYYILEHKMNSKYHYLNDVGVFELSSSRYQDGNDGAPIFVNRDGNWKVIGILSHTDGADRDVAVPINYTK